MEFIFEALFQLIGELVLQVVFEALAELGIRGLRAPFRKPPNAWLAAFGYVLLGVLAGALSLLVIPGLLIASPGARVANLVLTPIAAGFAMVALGAWRRHRHQRRIRLDRFAYGYLFALAMAFTRFLIGS
jgi:hypothetical protein